MNPSEATGPVDDRPWKWALIGIALPGLGHFMIGRAVRGVVALASSSVALLAGALLLGPRFRFSELAPFGLPVSLPESLALVPFMAVRGAFDAVGPAAERAERLPVDGEHLGFFVAGAGGILGLLWAADLVWHTSGRRRAASSGVIPAVAAALSWLLPGAGHWLAGQRDKGLLLGVAVLGMFVAGMLFGAGHAVDRGLFPIWWAGQNFCGGGSLVAALFTAPLTMQEYPPYLDLGVILCTTAGLMNVMVITDAYTVAEGTAPPAAGRAPAAGRPEVST